MEFNWNIFGITISRIFYSLSTFFRLSCHAYVSPLPYLHWAETSWDKGCRLIMECRGPQMIITTSTRGWWRYGDFDFLWTPPSRQKSERSRWRHNGHHTKKWILLARNHTDTSPPAVVLRSTTWWQEGGGLITFQIFVIFPYAYVPIYTTIIVYHHTPSAEFSIYIYKI